MNCPMSSSKASFIIRPPTPLRGKRNTKYHQSEKHICFLLFSCMSTCNRTGYSFAGVQNGSKCVCANEHPHSKSAFDNCKMACSGNENKTCGGDWKMNLYGAGAIPFPSKVSYMGCYSNTLERLLSGTYDNLKTNSPIQ